MRFVRRLWFGTAVVTLVAIAGCSAENMQAGKRDDATPVIAVIEDLRIGRIDGERPYLFGNARQVIPDASGRIWVMDGQNFELRLFDATGMFVRSVGREGQGPGEFGFNPCAHSGPNGEIWVEGGRPRHWTRFDSAGTLIGTLPAAGNIGCVATTRWTPDGRLLSAGSSGFGTDLRRYFVVQRLNGERLVDGDTIYAPRLPESPRVTWVKEGVTPTSYAIPLTHRSSYVLGADGDFWVTDGGGPYVIRSLAPNGATRVTFSRDYEPVPVADSTRDRLIQEFRREPEGYRAENGFDPTQVPHTYPPFERLYPATDGSLWVRRPLEGERIGFDVFAADGRYEGEAQVPGGFEDVVIHVITGDRIYGVARDDFDVQYVVRFAIRKAGG